MGHHYPLPHQSTSLNRLSLPEFKKTAIQELCEDRPSQLSDCVNLLCEAAFAGRMALRRIVSRASALWLINVVGSPVTEDGGCGRNGSAGYAASEIDAARAGEPGWPSLARFTVPQPVV